MINILILGGGFAATSTAKMLGALTKKRKDIQVSLVSEHNYFVFQPMLPEVAAGTLESSHIINPIRRLCKHVTFHRAKVDSIDTVNKTVRIIGNDFTRQQDLHYDHLVVAMGLGVDMSKVPGMNEHSLPMKTLGDAFFIRNDIINKLEEAAIETDPEHRRKLLTFTIIGGGFSGVETIGELNDMIRKAIKGYPQLSVNEVRMVLVHSRDRILLELGEKLALFAQKKLVKRGIELILNARVAEVTPESVNLNNGTKIPCKTVIGTTGNAPHSMIIDLPFVNSRGRLDTDEFFRVVTRDDSGSITETHESIWSLGDCAMTPHLAATKDEAGNYPSCAPTAQFAIRQGPVCGKNIYASIKNKKLKAFRFKELGQMAVIGHLTGVAEVMGIRFSGILAFIFWRVIYWMKLPGVPSKLRVAFDWFTHMFLPVDITQIDVFRSEKVDRSHYEEGSYIFRQGDIADYFYVIERGEVDIVIGNPDGTENVVAVLKEGDSFGEMGLMQKAARSASVRCRTPVGVLKVNRNDFKALTTAYADLRDNLESKVEGIQIENVEKAGQVNPTPPVEEALPESVELAPEADELKVALDVETSEPESEPENEIIPEPESDLEAPVEFDAAVEVVSPVVEAASPGFMSEFSEFYEGPSNEVHREDPSFFSSRKKGAERLELGTYELTRLGDEKKQRGLYNSACRHYYQAVLLRPNDVVLLIKLASGLRRSKRYSAAVPFLQRALALEKDNVAVIGHLAFCYTALGYYETAEALYQSGLRYAPDNINLQLNLAQLRYQMARQANE